MMMQATIPLSYLLKVSAINKIGILWSCRYFKQPTLKIEAETRLQRNVGCCPKTGTKCHADFAIQSDYDYCGL